MKNLEGNKALMLSVLGEIHGGHTTTPKLAIYGIVLRKSVFDFLDRRGLHHIAWESAWNRELVRNEFRSGSWSIHSLWPKPLSMARSRQPMASFAIPNTA